VVGHPGASEAFSGLAPPGSAERWSQLQRLRRESVPLQPWIEALARGTLPAAADLLAALWARMDRPAVERLLGGAAGAEPAPWLEAGRLELPALAAQPSVGQAWLEPLLQRQAAAPHASGAARAWLQLLGHFRDPRAAARLRRAIAEGASMPQADDALASLLPLLGQQRDPQDGALLLPLALAPGPLARRRAALEGLALGLSCWPPGPLVAGLETLTTDLDPHLASTAVDLLARLPQARRSLRRLLNEPLDPAVRARLRRRLLPTPLVLLVHGREGGAIPAELQHLAADLAQRRQAPVLLQALTAAPPEPDAAFWRAARRAAGLSLVPLLLLPGGHVRRDLPALAAAWRTRAAAEGPIALRRLPFLGAWPRLQRALAQELARQRGLAAAEGPAYWLHHPLEGPLARRFLAHLAAVTRCPGVATPYGSPLAPGQPFASGPCLLLPLTLAANRLSESLGRQARPPLRVLPPLLENPALREVLLQALTALP